VGGTTQSGEGGRGKGSISANPDPQTFVDLVRLWRDCVHGVVECRIVLERPILPVQKQLLSSAGLMPSGAYLLLWRQLRAS